MTEGTLPVALSSLIGRHREIEALAKLLASARMVTIAGSGGAGKTRLALAVAARTSARFPDGVWWADLAALGGADLLPGVVASVLAVPQSLPWGRGRPYLRPFSHLEHTRPLITRKSNGIKHILSSQAEMSRE